MIQEQLHLQVQKGDFHTHDTTKIIQSWISLISSSQVYKDPFDNESLRVTVVGRPQHVQFQTYFMSFQPQTPEAANHNSQVHMLL
jgi:hypothetical protein